MSKTTIQVSLKLRRKLNEYKYKLGCDTFEEFFEKILKIVDAGNFENESRKEVLK